MEYLDFICGVARKAGVEAMAYFNHKKDFSVATKDTYKDLVSSADKAVETLVMSEIRRAYPDHGEYGEESGRSGGDSEFCWVVDPIDGTQSFVRGQPYFSISIALKRNGKTIAGCVHAPRLDMTFSAERGRGAFENGAPIRCAQCDSVEMAACATGFACLRAQLPKNNLPICNRLFPIVRDIKRCGSAALDLCFVASGRYDVFWELALKEYDVAAGALIAEEAGAAVADMRGGTNYPDDGIVCANPRLLPLFLPYFQEA